MQHLRGIKGKATRRLKQAQVSNEHASQTVRVREISFLSLQVACRTLESQAQEIARPTSLTLMPCSGPVDGEVVDGEVGVLSLLLLPEESVLLCTEAAAECLVWDCNASKGEDLRNAFIIS